jgi:uncharacterized protein YdaU (DUF1376 family)
LLRLSAQATSTVLVDDVLAMFSLGSTRPRDRDLQGRSMNYYPRYPGDYNRDTSHLSLVEHGVYTKLLDHYYSREIPLPAELDRLYRITAATEDFEQRAVQTVADEFFPINAGDGLRHNGRADEEIAKWLRFQAEQTRKGRLGGRPSKAERKPEETRSLSPEKPAAKPEESRGKAGGKAGEKPGGKPDESPPTPTPDPDPEPSPEPPPTSGVLVGDSSDARRQQSPGRVKAAAYQRREFHDQVVAAYHETLPDLPAVRDWSERRRRKLNARIAERLRAQKPADTVEYWRKLFANVAASDFLTGRRTEWRCPGLEWLLEPKNFTKVIEGSYDNRSGNGANRAAAR